jgi:pilus assembly protein CpaC
MGIDLSASMNVGNTIVRFNNNNPFTANSAPLVPGNGLGITSGSMPSVQAVLRAMESAGVVRTLAEPNLTAISGESATFISGGEFPIPTGVTCQTTTAGSIGQCVQTVSFKKFGISLNFTPVVLSEGRISLRVMTEVSEVSTENALTGGQNGTTIPSIKTRRAETTLEIPSGGSMAMAGLIQEQTKQAVNGLPGSTSCRSRRAVPEPGLHQQPDRTDGSGDALCGRAVAQKELSRPMTVSRRRPIPSRPARPHQPDLRPRRSRRTGRRTRAILASSLTETARPRGDEDRTMTKKTGRSPSAPCACSARCSAFRLRSAPATRPRKS